MRVNLVVIKHILSGFDQFLENYTSSLNFIPVLIIEIFVIRNISILEFFFGRWMLFSVSNQFIKFFVQFFKVFDQFCADH